MNILVIGSGGQLGKEVQDATQMSQHQYFFTNSKTLDIQDIDAVACFCNANEIEVVLNCAAYTQVDKAESEQVQAEAINHLAVERLANLSKQLGMMFIHISTDYVFGGNQNLPYKEEDATSPLGVYGVTKRAGEEAIIASGCDHIIIRTAWLYSWRGKNFFNTMRHLTATKKEVKVVFDQVGTPTNATDLAQFLVEMIEQQAYKGRCGIYHYTNEGVCSWFDFAYAINELCHHKCVVMPCYSSQYPSVVQRPAYSVLDKTKIKETFNVTLSYWRDSLRECIKRVSYEEKL